MPIRKNIGNASSTGRWPIQSSAAHQEARAVIESGMPAGSRSDYLKQIDVEGALGAGREIAPETHYSPCQWVYNCYFSF